jgi:hypothetical protein
MHHRGFVLACALMAGLAATAPGEDRAIVILFGPAQADAGQKAAAAGAVRVREWLQSPGTSVELRRPGVREGQEVMKFMQPPAVQQAMTDAAKAGNAASLDSFMDALEMAVSAVARRPGSHFLIASLELPTSNDDLAYRMKQIVEACKSKKVQVLVWDLAATPAKDLTAWQTLASESGGGMGREFADVEAKLPASAAPAAVTAAVKPEGSAAPPGPVVYTGFWRSAPASATRGASTVGPMQGLVLTEVPVGSLKFVTQGGNATARIKVTQVLKKKSGETAWQATKEISIRSAANRLDERKRGSLCYARRTTIPAGEYVLESTVEDVPAEEKTTASAPLAATDSIPGLALSGAVFVRKLDKRMDTFEGDDLIQYDGIAMIPMLNPTFPANQPFELPVYFLIYPEIRGKTPQMQLDILQNGQVVGGTALKFTDKLHDDTREGGGGSGTGGEQHHEFPYLAKLANAMFLAGQYEVKITVKQDSQQVVRTVGFRVVEMK